MRPIPKKLREALARDPFMKRCIHAGCVEPPEWEHALIYAGKQINEYWAIVPVCTYHHRGAGLNKRYNQHRALQRATTEDFAKYPKQDWERLKTFLEEMFKSI